MSIMFNEICINEEMLPKYTYIYIYIYRERERERKKVREEDYYYQKAIKAISK